MTCIKDSLFWTDSLVIQLKSRCHEFHQLVTKLVVEHCVLVSLTTTSVLGEHGYQTSLFHPAAQSPPEVPDITDVSEADSTPLGVYIQLNIIQSLLWGSCLSPRDLGTIMHWTFKLPTIRSTFFGHYMVCSWNNREKLSCLVHYLMFSCRLISWWLLIQHWLTSTCNIVVLLTAVPQMSNTQQTPPSPQEEGETQMSKCNCDCFSWVHNSIISYALWSPGRFTPSHLWPPLLFPSSLSTTTPR